MAQNVKKQEISKRELTDTLFKLVDFVTENPQLLACNDVGNPLWSKFSDNIKSDYSGETWSKYWMALVRGAKLKRAAVDNQQRKRALSHPDLRALDLADRHDRIQQAQQQSELQHQLQLQHQHQTENIPEGRVLNIGMFNLPKFQSDHEQIDNATKPDEKKYFNLIKSPKLTV